MDKRSSLSSPFFEPALLRADLKRLAKEYPDAKAMRGEIVKRLKGIVTIAHEETRARLESDRHGRRAAEGLATFADELIRALYDFVAGHVYEASNPSASEHLAIIATGGYGRGLLAPYSDIDLLFLLPYKQTAWGESVVEYILYVLWDLGLKVGHATRSVDQCVALSRSDMTIRTAILDGRLILGEATLFAELERRFRSDVIAGTGAEFVDAKLAERESRQLKIGSSRYLVEPNVKEGKGGLRDLHTLHWLI
ncbi:MAG: bifunctional uridylyltransferase/uridylyl-removing protein, partial [Hyphomicrobiaceae bacterium]